MPPIRVAAAMSAKPPLMTALACDLGGTRSKLGIVRDGRVLAQSIVPSNSKQGLAPLLPTLKAEWLRLLDESALKLDDCRGVGVSFPSLIDHAFRIAAKGGAEVG